MAHIARTPQEIAHLKYINDRLFDASSVVRVFFKDGHHLDGVVRGTHLENAIEQTGGPRGELRPVGHSMTLRLLLEDGRIQEIDLFEVRDVVDMWAQNSQDYARRGLITIVDPQKPPKA